MSPSYLLLACDVFLEEIAALDSPPPAREIRWFPMGLHDQPSELRRRLENELANLSDEIEEVRLLYGLCGGGLDGVRAGRQRLRVPRTPDCIALLLGSSEKHARIQRENLGTYFFAPGWIREKRVPGPDRWNHMRTEYARRYPDDAERVEELLEVDREAFGHYNKAVFIQTPAGKAEHQAYCSRCAEHMGWSCAAETSDPTWFREFLFGPADQPDRFVVVEPGQVLRMSPDSRIFRVEDQP